MAKKIVMFDMDGVLTKWVYPDTGKEIKEIDPECMYAKGFFRNLPVMPGAKEVVQQVFDNYRYDTYILTKATTKNLDSVTEKYQWMEEHFPYLLNRIFIACNKAFVHGDYLIDDDVRWEPVYAGRHIVFDEHDPETSWQLVRDILRLEDYRHQFEKIKKL